MLLLVVSRAYADPAPELTKEFQAGVDAFRLGHFAEARTHLEKARDMDPKLPGPHRFLAAVLQAEGHWQECLDESRLALAANPSSFEATSTKKLHADCRASAGRTPYSGPELVDSAAIAVTTNIDGATVRIGGLTYGGTPLAPRPISAGKLELDIDKAGWKSKHVSVDAPAGIVTDVAIELEPDPNAQQNVDLSKKPLDAKIGWLVIPSGPGGAAFTVDGKPVQGKVELPSGEHTVEAREPDKDVWRRRVRVLIAQEVQVHPVFVDTAEREGTVHVGEAVLAGGAVLLGAGFVTGLVAEHASSDAREIQRVESQRDPNNPAYDLEPKHTRADFTAATDRAHTFGLVSDLAIGAAAVTIGIGAYYMYKGERERDDVPPPFAIAPTHGGAMVAKELRW